MRKDETRISMPVRVGVVSRGDDANKARSLRRCAGLLCRRLSRMGGPALLFFVASSAVMAFLALYILPRAVREYAILQAGLKTYASLSYPPDTIPVLIPTYSRPAYLAAVLESLRKARSIEKTVLIFSQDGADTAVSALIASVNFTRVVHLRHAPPYWGLPSVFLRTDAPTASNVYFLLRFAFEWLRAPAAIVLESDIVVAPDALDYFRWAFTEVSRDAALRDRIFTINGFYDRSRPEHDPYAFTTHEYGFMVWGWLCPGFSWPLIRAGWTSFGNWDITLENSVRQPSGKVSLSPVVSRTRNIGMQGINFDVRDPATIEKWTSMHISETAREFDGHRLSILRDFSGGGAPLPIKS